MNANRTQRRGFTLMELMIATAISVILILALVSTFIQQRRAYKTMADAGDMDQNLRTAIEQVSREIRTAGYGMAVPPAQFGSWFTWFPGASITTEITVVQGSSGASDTIHLVGAFNPPSATTTVAIAAGATTITVGSGQGAQFNSISNRVIFLGQQETVEIVSVAGDTLTVSTHPTITGRGLKYAYPSGTPIEIVRVVSYFIGRDTWNYPYTPNLQRVDTGTALPHYWQRMVANYVEDMQATPLGLTGVRLSFRVRAQEPDPKYWNATYGDRFRRTTAQTEVMGRRPQIAYN